MPRMRFTTQAMNIFTKSLIEGRRKGGVGSENLDIGLKDGDLNLRVRDGVRQAFGGKLTAARVQKLEKAAFDGGQVTDDEAVYLLKLGLDDDNFEHKKVGASSIMTEAGRTARFDLLRFAVMHLADIDPSGIL